MKKVCIPLYLMFFDKKYKNELITWGCIFLFGTLSIIFYNIII